MIAVESQASVRSAPRIPLNTRLGPVVLGVTDRARALAIWQDVVGLELLSEDAAALHLGIGSDELITLELGAARPVPERSLGLYHVAVHVTSRVELAQMLVRALQRKVRVSPTDHLVSEAIYLWDFDGNGIEITFETPWRGRIGDAEEGTYVVTADGSQHSGREPIDVDGLLAELGPSPTLLPRMAAGTRIGHIHLHVKDLEESMRFYRDGIGFGGLFIMRQFGMGDLGLDYMPHALAFNIWSGPRATQPPEGSAGLRHFSIRVPDAAAVADVGARLTSIGAAFEAIDDGIAVRDPSGNLMRVVAG